jgi:hypothetical protein
MGRLDLLPFVVNGLMGVCSIYSSQFKKMLRFQGVFVCVRYASDLW